MERGKPEVTVIAGEPAKFTDTANMLDRFVTTAKVTCELSDGSKGTGISFNNDNEEAKREALYNAYADRAERKSK